jgi:hypothetical protein
VAPLLDWKHSAFTVHNHVRVSAGQADGREQLARYMLRSPFFLDKTT